VVYKYSIQRVDRPLQNAREKRQKTIALSQKLITENRAGIETGMDFRYPKDGWERCNS